MTATQAPWRSACKLGPIALACGMASLAGAQSGPNAAGALLQQMEQRRTTPLNAAPAAPIVRSEPSAEPMGQTVEVKEIRLVGNRLLTQAQLAPVVQPYENRVLSFAQLQQAAADVARSYQQAGWLVRAFLPRQEVQAGVTTRAQTPRLLALVESQQAKGLPVAVDAVDRTLLLLEDLPGVAVSGNLQAGPAAGETSLLLKVADKPWLVSDVSLDNGGGRATGPVRVMGNVVLAGAAGRGDQGTATLIHTQGSDYARLGYSLPVGYDGWRVGGNASVMTYQVVTPEMVALNAHGKSVTAGLEASYPFIRSRLKNLNLAVAADYKRFENSAGGAVTTDFGVSTLALGLSGQAIDTWLGLASSTASLTWVHGVVQLDGSPNQTSDASTARTAGSFNKLRYSLGRQQSVRPDLTASVAVSGQFTDKNLDGSEKFSLGGSSGVRAYPSGEGSGSRGTLVNLELRKTLPGNASVAGFYDWGRVNVNHDNNFTGGAVVNQLALQGWGLTAAWLAPGGINLKATWARRLGSNPVPSATGTDQDGTLVKNRFWLQASTAF